MENEKTYKQEIDKLISKIAKNSYLLGYFHGKMKIKPIFKETK